MAESARTRGAAIRLIVARLLLRRAPPGRLVRTGALVGAGLTVVGLVGVFTGTAMLASVVATSAGALIWLAAEVGRRVSATIAVSIVGIALGVSALFTVGAVMNGFESEVVQRSARVNGHVLVTKYGLDFFEYEELSDRLLRRPEVVGASPFAVGAVAFGRVAELDSDGAGQADPVVGLLKGLHPRRAPSLAGMDEVLSAPLADALRPGHLQRPPGITLGVGLARRIGVDVGEMLSVVAPAAIDGSLQVDGAPRAARFEVTALMDTGVADLDNEFALVHLSAAQFVLFGEGRVTGIELLLDEIDDATADAQRLVAAINPAGAPLYRATSWLEASTTLVMLRQVGQVVGLIVGLIVVVAASTLIGALLLLVRHRRRDIAVLRTIGADRLLLWVIFEALGLTAGLAGVLAGLGLGGLNCLVISRWEFGIEGTVYPIDVLPVVPTMADALIPAAVALVVCALASGPGAIAAARTPPLGALRSE